MITKSGMSTFNYAVSVGELLTGTWTTPTKSPLPNAVLSCAINGTQLIAVLQGKASIQLCGIVFRAKVMSERVHCIVSKNLTHNILLGLQMRPVEPYQPFTPRQCQEVGHS